MFVFTFISMNRYRPPTCMYRYILLSTSMDFFHTVYYSNKSFLPFFVNKVIINWRTYSSCPGTVSHSRELGCKFERWRSLRCFVTTCRTRTKNPCLEKNILFLCMCTTGKCTHMYHTTHVIVIELLTINCLINWVKFYLMSNFKKNICSITV